MNRREEKQSEKVGKFKEKRKKNQTRLIRALTLLALWVQMSILLFEKKKKKSDDFFVVVEKKNEKRKSKIKGKKPKQPVDFFFFLINDF